MSAEKIKGNLAKLPEPDSRNRDWPDYAKLGFSDKDLEDLMEVARDFYLDLTQDDKASSLSIHAWRAMVAVGGCLENLVELSIECDLIDDDWFRDEFPLLLGKLGLQESLELREIYQANSEFTCLAEGLIEGLPYMARDEKDREKVIEVLISLFEEKNFDRYLRGLTVASLEDLKAVEAIEVIRGQFAQNRIDISIVGDLEEVEMSLGLRKKRETEKPDFQLLEQEIALIELKNEVGAFPKEGSLDEKLRYFLLRYGNPRAIKRVDELDGFLLACVLANPNCATEEASFCVWDILGGGVDWQPDFETKGEEEAWLQSLEEVLGRIKNGLEQDCYEPYTLVWPDAAESMDPDVPYFTPWLEGYMQGYLAFSDEDEELSENFVIMVQEVFETEEEGTRLLEDRKDNPIYHIISEITGRYGQSSGEGFRFNAHQQQAWLASDEADNERAVSHKSEVSRNDPCPCGSGRKYKKCCMN